jgi:hypothetical protein
MKIEEDQKWQIADRPWHLGLNDFSKYYRFSWQQVLGTPAFSANQDIGNTERAHNIH